MDKKLDVILDILQPNTHRHDPNEGGDDTNSNGRRGGMSDPRRFSTGTGSTGIPGMMMSEGNSQASSRIMSRTHSMEHEDGQEGIEIESVENSKQRKRRMNLVGASKAGGNHGLESSELTKRLERLKDEDVLRQRINSTTSNDGGEHVSKVRARTQSSRFTVTPSLYTPNIDLSRETIDIDIDDVITEDQTGKSNKSEQNEKIVETSSSINSENSQSQLQKPFGGNLKKYLSVPSLPPPPKHKSLKDKHSNNTDIKSSLPTHGSLKDTDFRRSSSVHFDESSLVKHRSQSEIFPVYRDPGYITSASSQPSLMPRGRSSSISIPSPQQKQQRQPVTKTSSTTTSNLSVNDIRGNAYVSDIDSSDEANSSRNSTPAREHSTVTTPRLSSRGGLMVTNSNNSADSVDSTKQQQQGNKPISDSTLKETIQTTKKNNESLSTITTTSTQQQSSAASSAAGDASYEHKNSIGKPQPSQQSLTSETTFSSSSQTLTTPENQTNPYTSNDVGSQNSSSGLHHQDKTTSSALLPPPPVQTTRRKSEPLNSTGQTSEPTTTDSVNSNGHLSKSAFNLNC